MFHSDNCTDNHNIKLPRTEALRVAKKIYEFINNNIQYITAFEITDALKDDYILILRKFKNGDDLILEISTVDSHEFTRTENFDMYEMMLDMEEILKNTKDTTLRF